MTLETIKKTQSILLSDIENNYKKNNLNKVVSLIDTYAFATQLINNELYNDKIEKTIEDLSKGIMFSSLNDNREDNVVVFYDQIGTTICLSEQYIDGILELGYKLIYIYENPYCSISASLKNKLSKLNIESYIFNSSKSEDQLVLAKKIYYIINRSRCNKLLIQSPAYGALSSIVLSGLRNIARYRIVPGDHHFYIGTKCTDYFLEFRPYGITRAVKERYITPNKIIKLPYYPIIDNGTRFNGFPIDTEGKFVIVTAGDTYKFWGSELFYEICERLAQIENVVVLFIGKHNKKLDNLIKQKRLGGKIVQLGYRRDFAQCLRHCNVLLSSYPMIGGLISQMAAVLGKPIIAYAEKIEIDNGLSFEDILGNNRGERRISKPSVGDVLEYAKELINNKDFLISEGIYIKSLIQTKERFNKELGIALTTPKSNISKGDYVEFVDNVSSVKNYINVQNSLSPSFIMPLIKEYKGLFILKFKHHLQDCLKNPIMTSKYYIYTYYEYLKMKLSF